MVASSRAALEELGRCRAEFGGDMAARKLVALRRLEQARLPSARAVLELHETLCFLRACPDEETILAQVERMLAAFARRADLRRHARALADSGIAGTTITFPFFADTAAWLALRHPGRLRIAGPGSSAVFERVLPLLALYAESPALDELDFGVRGWLKRMKGPAETDAEFVLRRIAALGLGAFQHEALYELLELPLQLSPGPGLPSRTHEKLAGAPVTFQRRPLERGRPDLRRGAQRRPRAIEAVPPAEAQRIVDLARAAMVSRARDLDAFCYGDPRDVRRVRWEDGLEFAVIGVIPERRLLLESVYAFLTLRNGVPIGYVLVSALFGSSEIAYNVFETWRGAEAAHIYARVLATTRALFGSDTFTIMPYQLGGYGNEEGIASGAWWFYRKLGFEPRDDEGRRLAAAEEAAVAGDPAHRTHQAALRRLARHNLYFSLGRVRADVIGELELANVGLHVMRYVAARFGSQRGRAERACARDAARRLGVPLPSSSGERLAWNRWGPLVMTLPGLERWSPAARRALAAVIRAKGGRRESDFVARFDAHRPLRQALAALAAREP